MKNFLGLVFFAFSLAVNAQTSSKHQVTYIVNGINDALQFDSTYFSAAANIDSSVMYHLKSYAGANSAKYFAIQITEQGVVLFEYLEESQVAEVDLGELDLRREEWMKICNQHDALALVKEMYMKEAVYYNHKPLVIGQEKIVEQYSYMNDEKYSLELEPLFMQVVSSEIVYEVGQCRGSYGGKYILVWTRDIDGKWKIKMDSNL